MYILVRKRQEHVARKLKPEVCSYIEARDETDPSGDPTGAAAATETQLLLNETIG